MMFEGRSWSGHERNCCFLNLGEQGGGKQFANVSATSGLDFPDDGRAVAVVDWDQDGDLDLWMSNRNAPRLRLMRNGSSRAHSISIRLRDNGVDFNRDAIGGRVEVVLRSGKKLIRTVRAGSGFLSQSSKWLHFGLGSEPDGIVNIIVTWPDGFQSVVGPARAGDRFMVLRNGGRKEIPQRDQQALALQPAEVILPPQNSNARVPAVTRYPSPVIRYQTDSGKAVQHPNPRTTGRWLLVNLWASWCAPCLAELNEFKDRATELKAVGVDVLALSVDGVSTTGQGDRAAASATLKRLGFPFPSGHADQAMIEALQQLDNHLTAAARPLPVPTSFLIDPENRVAVLYKGKVSVDQIIDDASKVDLDLEERWLRAAVLPGTSIKHPAIIETRATFAATWNFRRGKVFEATAPQQAMYFFNEALIHRKDFHRARTQLGKLLGRQGRDGEATEQLNYVMQQAPEFANAPFELAMMTLLRGKRDEAIAGLEALLEKHPNHAATQNNLAWLLATHPDPAMYDPARALKLARQAVAATKEELPGYLDTLAVAEAANGEFEASVKTLDRAIVVARAAEKSAMLPDLQKRRVLFMQRRPLERR